MPGAGRTPAGVRPGERPAWTPAAAPTRPIAEIERTVVQRVNEIRRERELQALEPVGQLAQVAREHNCQMAEQGFFSHVGPAGEDVADRVAEVGFDYHLLGESLARVTNAPQPAAVAVQGWMDSPGHRQNILREGFASTGVGACRHGTTYFLIQIFTQRLS